MKKQNGYTIIELILLVGVVATVAIAGGLVYVAAHFISKIW